MTAISYPALEEKEAGRPSGGRGFLYDSNHVSQVTVLEALEIIEGRLDYKLGSR